MNRVKFEHIDQWVFDLDNTLYPAEMPLFDQIKARMREFIATLLGVDATAAAALRDAYWRQYGTTLAGLMAEHDVAPDPFLAAVHDIDLSALTPDPALDAAIRALPGRRIVYTNGSRAHALRVLEARGLGQGFDAIFGVEDAGYRAKPAPEAFRAIFDKAGLATRSAAMFEDDIRNLEVPFALGMRTVHVGPTTQAPHVDHSTGDLTAFLSQLGRGRFPSPGDDLPSAL
ncbi:MAG: pyrimidine 5'-nucleotidase [Pseudomonadota bacterium]